MSVPKHNHSAIRQDLIPDTPCSTVSAAVAEKELCSCSCLGDQLFSAGCTSSWGCPSENVGKWTQRTRSGQVSRLLPLVRLGARPSISVSTIYSDLFNINPKACRNPVAPVKVLCQTEHPPVQGMKPLHHVPSVKFMEQEGPFLSQEDKQKFSKQLKRITVLPNLYYPGLPSSLPGLQDAKPPVFIILKLGRLIRRR